MLKAQFYNGSIKKPMGDADFHRSKIAFIDGNP